MLTQKIIFDIIKKDTYVYLPIYILRPTFVGLFLFLKIFFKKLYFLKMIIYNKIRGEVFWQII